MNFSKSIIKWVFIITSICPNFCFGQFKNNGIPELKNFSKSEYSAGTQNWAIDQDANGNMYFANNSGLLQYDGVSWYKHLMPNNNSVRSIKNDKSGKIYVGSFNEFGYFEANKNGILTYHSLSKYLSKKNINTIDFIWKVHVMNDEIIFQSFQNLYCYKNKKISIYKAPHKFQFSFLVNNNLYIQDIQNGLLLYSSGKFKNIPNTVALNATEVWGMLPITESKILIATIDKGLFIYENQTLKSWKSEANDFVAKNNSLGCVSLINGFFVINSVLDGIIVCDKNGKIIQKINQKKGLQNNTVLCSFADQNNNVWLGLDNGITFLNMNSPFTTFGSSYNIGTVYASTIYNKTIYVATNQGLFYRSVNTEFDNDGFKLVIGTTGQAWNIQVLEKQLICAHNRGAFLITNANTIKMLDTVGYWSFKSIPNRPEIVIASNYNGFAIFDKPTNQLRYRNQIRGFANSVNSFEVDATSIWFIKDGLLNRLLLSDDLKYIKKTITYSGLSKIDNSITSIQMFEEKILFQAKNTFYSFSSSKQGFEKQKKITDLFASQPEINFFKEDEFGNIWFEYDESLGLYAKKGKFYQNQSALLSNLTGNLVPNYISVTAVNPTNFYIGMIDGLTNFDVTSSQIKSKPKAFIRSFSYGKQLYFVGNNKKQIDFQDLSYHNNNVNFTFSTPIFESKKPLFSYQLVGFESNWSTWSTVNTKEYTNLREGNYSMKLRSQNSFGLVSDTATIRFTINPPWYRSVLAYFLYLIVAGLSIHLVRMNIQAKIRRNKYYETIEQRKIYLEKESKIKQEQFELEKEIERLKNEKLKTAILSKDKELVSNSLQVVKKNKILNGILSRIKDIETETLNENTKMKFVRLNKSIINEVNADKSWNELEKHIKNVHFDFLKRLKEKYPTISPRECDLATYLLMNMSTKEIAEIMNISSQGVELARYRLRKKIGLTRDQNLSGYLMTL